MDVVNISANYNLQNTSRTGNTSAAELPERKAETASSVIVNISDEARQMQGTPADEPRPTPVTSDPEENRPLLSDEQRETATEVVQIRAKYRVASDLINPQNNGVSPVTAYAIKNNEEVAEVATATFIAKQTANQIDIYQQNSQPISSGSSNNSGGISPLTAYTIANSEQGSDIATTRLIAKQTSKQIDIYQQYSKIDE